VEILQDFPDLRYTPADFEDYLPKEENSEARPGIEPESRLMGAQEGERLLLE